jgi:hypothetical protein
MPNPKTRTNPSKGNPQRRAALQSDSDSGHATGTPPRTSSRLEQRAERLKQATRR